jgi:hypothetical protein
MATNLFEFFDGEAFVATVHPVDDVSNPPTG